MKLSAAQHAVFERMKVLDIRIIERQPGGFWTIGGKPYAEWYASTPTVKAMERLDLLRPVDWAFDTQGSFPIAYVPTQAGLDYITALEGQ